MTRFPSARAQVIARNRAVKARGLGRVRSVGGSYRGSMSNWNTPRMTQDGEASERAVISRRAEDLVDNNPNAASVIDSMAVNVIGPGLRPQARVDRKALGLTEDQADALQASMEKAYKVWNLEAHSRGLATFNDLQFMGLHSVLTKGEFLFLPRMLDDAKYPNRSFSFALQDIHPSRLSTPADFFNRENIVDGVEINGDGRPEAYWVSSPGQFNTGEMQSSGSYTRIPAENGHRPGMLHGFRLTREEQYRGRSVLSPAMKYYRLLDDSYDYNLISQIMAASIPVFISTQNPYEAAAQGSTVPEPVDENGNPNPLFHKSYGPGTILYGAPNEKPHILESNHPGNNFEAFARLILRAMAAATGMPYEVLSKDFSQTNYSSARAALLEAWRVYLIYRAWAGVHFCQVNWAMVQEEAWLRGMWEMPSGAPDFYDARHAYLGTRWIGPARGYIDPVKEIVASIKGLENNIITHADVVAEQGGDGQEVAEIRAAEIKRDRDLGLAPEEAA
ncbi:phage portal protein [Pseudodesulfovibrio sp. JC047]|uniref:phage portal protein n=1 Tax=Pseudodesulfovibrio sp. JC047 TaxID=2683199 RepID=UPI0013D05BFE|nr:phage portal protein [Pseudodesulfovibrio sp. JC047]NDV20010.1 phage portal protein [Pseudodesulfovibrio sp. JC047]